MWGYIIHYKDKHVCVLENPKDKKARPICIPQQVGPNGLSLEIMKNILFEAKLDEDRYFQILAKVLARQQRSIH